MLYNCYIGISGLHDLQMMKSFSNLVKCGRHSVCVDGREFLGIIYKEFRRVIYSIVV